MDKNCCDNQPEQPTESGFDICCEVPKTPTGYTAEKVYYLQMNDKLTRGYGIASSFISLQDAKDKALEAAVLNAKLRAGCGTPPIGGQQLFCDWCK